MGNNRFIGKNKVQKEFHQNILDVFARVIPEIIQNATGSLLRATCTRFIYLFNVRPFFQEGNLIIRVYGEFIRIPSYLQEVGVNQQKLSNGWLT